MMKILVTGKAGQLGSSIKKVVDEKKDLYLNNFEFIFIGKEELIKSILEANIVKNTLAHIIPSSSYASVLHKLIGTSALDIQKHIKEFNDPNNIYSKCLTCEITY